MAKSVPVMLPPDVSTRESEAAGMMGLRVSTPIITARDGERVEDVRVLRGRERMKGKALCF